MPEDKDTQVLEVPIATPQAVPVASEEGAPEPQPDVQAELRKLQSTKDREISALMQHNRDLVSRLEAMERSQAEAHIRTIEDPEERANATIAQREKELAAKEAYLYQQAEERSYPVVLAMLSQKYSVPVEVLQGARSAPEMENMALRYKLEHLGQDLDAEKKKATKAPVPAATEQKFASSGEATSSYDPKKFVSTGDIAGSLRAKREAGL